MPGLKKDSPMVSNWTVADLGSFYSSNRSALKSHAERILKDSVQAEEVVHEGIIRVLLAAPELQSEQHALMYIKKVIENLSIDLLRAQGKRPHLVLIDDATSDLDQLSSKTSTDIDDQIAAADDAAVVRQAISMLSPAERAALVMWEVEGRSTEEIARELGVKESAVRHTVSRARASLRRILSEMVIDQERGLTALDLLSTTYKKSAEVAKKSSRAALSILLLLFAYLGFVNVNDTPQSGTKVLSQKATNHSGSNKDVNSAGKVSSKGNKISTAKALTPKASVGESNAKAATLSFPGLDKNGVPTGFTVTDNSGALGTLYFNGRETVLGDAGLTLSSIAKTSTVAANILLNQTLTQDSNGLAYDALISFGRQGAWIPTFTKVISVESERLVSGNYLVTAVVQVKSEVETTIMIPAVAGGRDLEVPPSRVITRILLNPAKTQILAQAVQVVEKVSK